MRTYFTPAFTHPAGRASIALDRLRYASLTAGGFSSSVRWEADVVKLEETVLLQAGSRWVTLSPSHAYGHTALASLLL